MHKHLHRLPLIQKQPPVFFITTCTSHHNAVLAGQDIVSIIVEEWKSAFPRHGWKVGRFVVMPDHVHFICAPIGESAQTLSCFMQGWKQWTGKRLHRESGLATPIWQAGFFDHLLRSTKSAREKWEYIVNNPVAAGLVSRPEDWPWQGEIYPSVFL